MKMLLKCPDCECEKFDYKDNFYICGNCGKKLKLILPSYT